jgi:hypothetical protein
LPFTTALSTALLAVVLLSAGAEAQGGGNPGTGRDAQQYAADYGVTVGEAMRRLQLQARASRLEARLASQERGTFGGLYIEHRPRFRVVAKFTRDPDATLSRNAPEAELAAETEAVAAERTLVDLEQAQLAVYGAVTGLGVQAESGIDIPAGRIKLYVLDEAPIQRAVATGTLQIPAYVDIVRVPHMSRRQVDIVGGRSLTAGGSHSCTSGFSVRNSAGTRGILTAGHCSNTLAYNGSNLPFVAERFATGTKYDLQWHTAPGFTVVNQIYEGLASNRTITGIWPYASQTVGSFVCKYGHMTGYGCGDIVDRNYILDGSGGFIRIHNANNQNLTNYGDSGGPWFLVAEAYGIHIAEPPANTNDAIYMPIDYISVIGISVLTAP